MLEDAIRANCSVDGGVYLVKAGGAGGAAVVAEEVSADAWVSVVTAAGMSAAGMSAAGISATGMSAAGVPGEEVPDEERPGSLAFTWASG